MKDFILAALPFIAWGLIIIVLFIKIGREQKSPGYNMQHDINDDLYGPRNKKTYDYSSVGMTVGVCVGIGLGWLEILELRYGIPFGLLIGLLIGMCIKKK